MSFFKSIWKGNLKHKKLYDERTLAFDCEPMSDPAVEEVTFRAKYLGSTLVEKASSEEATADAVKTILSMAKAGGKKLQRVAVILSLNGIKVVDIPTEETHLDVSIYRISYCSADATHSQVFAFIATNANETMECHAFLCPKRKTAQIMSLTLARVFRTAYDLLADTLREEKYILGEKKMEKEMENNVIREEVDAKGLLIDFGSEPDQNRVAAWIVGTVKVCHPHPKEITKEDHQESVERCVAWQANHLGWCHLLECFEEDTADNIYNARFWDSTGKNSGIDTFGTNHFRNFIGNSRWEDSRTNLLCS